ncbi:MAG: hypothetical protein ED557_04690 [Balneola sp.]|nr:MAG: hypothetical protein ED557_04690 [Balneola sp.]
MPKIALLSDIHGNLSALKNSIRTLEKKNPDLWLCLGDIVGYGPFPSECIKLVREFNMVCVKGNHDAGVTGDLGLKHFRDPNRKLIELTSKELEVDELNWLKGLPLVVRKENWMAVHSSPDNPEKWEYIESAFRARDLLNEIDVELCFLGHTHRPALVSNQLGVYEFKKGYKYMINPGSIGQSRDGDYRAACSFIDTENFEYKNFRIEFDQEENLSALMRKGFSRAEARRLLRL